MGLVLLNDEDIRRIITPQLALAAIREAFEHQRHNRLIAPPRLSRRSDPMSFDFTAGAVDHEYFGYRSNIAGSGHEPEQVVTLQDYRSGQVKAIAVGHALGPLRTGAIGAAAIDTLSRPDSEILAIIGSGPQAWTQLWAVSSVRNLAEVRIFSRSETRRCGFASKASEELGLKVVPSAEPEQAVAGADVVILATTSSTPVIRANWLKPGAHVNALGSKHLGNSEFDKDLPDIASLIATDSRAQLFDLDGDLILGNKQASDIRSLCDIDKGSPELRRNGSEVTLFLSVGLAGTEVVLLNYLLKHN